MHITFTAIFNSWAGSNFNLKRGTAKAMAERRAVRRCKHERQQLYAIQSQKSSTRDDRNWSA